MGIISKWIGKVAKRELTSEMFNFTSGSSAGVDVNRDSVVSISAVYAALNLITSTIATLPLNVYKHTNSGRVLARDFNLYDILHTKPNEMMTSVKFRQLMGVNYYIGGAAHAIIVWNNKGQVKELIPVPFWRVRRTIINGKQFYDISSANGQTKRYSKGEIFKLENIGFEHGNPFEPLKIGRDIFGLSKAAESFGANFFANGATTSGILKHPGTLDEQVINRLKNSFNERYQGVGKSHKTMILEEGMEYLKTSVTPNEGQFTETRKFQVTEVARFFNVPPHMIMDLERATFSNIEHQNINFAIYSLRPKLIEWEQEISRSLMSTSERKLYYAEFILDALLRGDSETRTKNFAMMRNNGVLSANEWREKENMNSIGEQGDVYFMPLNMAPTDTSLPVDEVVERNTQYNLLSTRQLNPQQIRSATSRHTLAKNAEPLFNQRASNVVNKEVEDIKKIANETLNDEVSNNIEAFNIAIDKYYKDMPKNIRQQMKTVFTGLADNVFAEAVEEINSNDKWDSHMEKFIDQYLGAFAARYINSSVGQLKSLASSGLQAVEERLAEWQEKRPGKVSLNETVRLSGAVTKTAFSLGGVTKIKWINMGSKSCPYCEKLDGTVVGIEQNFVNSGDNVKDMAVSHNTGHPPLHAGCVCTIISN